MSTYLALSILLYFISVFLTIILEQVLTVKTSELQLRSGKKMCFCHICHFLVVKLKSVPSINCIRCYYDFMRGLIRNHQEVCLLDARQDGFHQNWICNDKF